MIIAENRGFLPSFLWMGQLKPRSIPSYKRMNKKTITPTQRVNQNLVNASLIIQVPVRSGWIETYILGNKKRSLGRNEMFGLQMKIGGYLTRLSHYFAYFC